MKTFRNCVLAWFALVACALVLNACGGGGGGYGGGSTGASAASCLPSTYNTCPTTSASGSSTAGMNTATACVPSTYNSCATSSSSSAGCVPTTYNSCAGTANGTVNGFGSIVVDGHEFQEMPATVYQTEARGKPESLAADGVQLGQHVVVSFDANGNITLVDVIPEVEGPVSSITSSVKVGSGSSATTMPAITVAGVLVVGNTDLSQGPVTNYGGGYTSLANVLVGDNVEVHGLLRSANGIDYVQATFVGKQPSFVGTRITGIVAAYNATANTFTLGTAPNVVTINAGGASVLPSGASIANGEVVSVWSNGTITANMLTANVVNVRSGLGIAGETLAVSGPISAYVSQASFVVNGVTVDASAITLPMGVSALANGMTVAVSGTVNSNGTLAATQLRVFSDQDDTTPPVVLQGDIGDFVSAANFTVRGVVVDASHNPTFNSGFSAANLQDGAFVKITGTLTNNVVVATSVTFTSMHGTPVLDLKATVQSYTASSGALTVTLELPGSGQSTTVTITLGSSVTYDNGSAAMLTAGQKIKIHAIYDAASNTFTVTAISFMPPGNDDDQGSSNRGNGGNGGAGNPVLLQGIVTAVNPGSGTVSSFTVHGLTINVGTASVSSAPGLTGGIAVGDLVAIYGTNASTDDTVNASAILVAPAPAAKGDD